MDTREPVLGELLGAAELQMWRRAERALRPASLPGDIRYRHFSSGSHIALGLLCVPHSQHTPLTSQVPAFCGYAGSFCSLPTLVGTGPGLGQRLL